MRTKAVAVAALLAGVAAQPLAAKEGMFTPEQLPEIADDLREAGLELDPNSLTDLTEFPMGAVVSLGGCSASFVEELTLAGVYPLDNIRLQSLRLKILMRAVKHQRIARQRFIPVISFNPFRQDLIEQK